MKSMITDASVESVEVNPRMGSWMNETSVNGSSSRTRFQSGCDEESRQETAGWDTGDAGAENTREVSNEDSVGEACAYSASLCLVFFILDRN